MGVQNARCLDPVIGQRRSKLTGDTWRRNRHRREVILKERKLPGTRQTREGRGSASCWLGGSGNVKEGRSARLRASDCSGKARHQSGAQGLGERETPGPHRSLTPVASESCFAGDLLRARVVCPLLACLWPRSSNGRGRVAAAVVPPLASLAGPHSWSLTIAG